MPLNLLKKRRCRSMRFTVCGSAWFLVFVRPMDNRLLRSDGSRTIGVSDNKVKTVFIADNLPEKLTDKVLCHELCHVFSFENNLDIPIDIEEMISDFMSKYGRDIIYLADRIMRDMIGMVA